MKENIDKIIDKSMKKTEELEKQLKSIEDKFNLNNVSLTGDDDTHKTSIYQIDGEVITKKQIQDSKNQIQKMRTFIDIGARKKQNRNYNINDNFRDALKGPDAAGKVQGTNASVAPANSTKKKFKGWKAQVGGGFDHQFFDNKKLDELEKKENAWSEYEQKKEEWPEGKAVPAEFTEADSE